MIVCLSQNFSRSFQKRYRRVYHFLYDETSHRTATERRKDKEINYWHDVAQDVNTQIFRESRVTTLATGEMSMDDFMSDAKKKNSRFLKELLPLRNKTRKKVSEQRRYEALEKRYSCFLAHVKERKERERQGMHIVEIMQQLIKHEQEIVKEIVIPQPEIAAQFIVNKVIRGLFQSRKKSIQKPNKLARFLPSTNANDDADVVNSLLQRRIVERQLERKSKHFFKWLLSQPISEQEEDERRQNATADHLIYAAQVGDYRRVLDLIDCRENIAFGQDSLVDVNAIGGDRSTALYTALLTAIEQEMVEDTDIIEKLLYSPLERFFRKFQLGMNKINVLDTIRFDYVIQILLHYGGDMMFPKLDQHGRDGLTILHVAISTGAVEVVEFLLNRGMDINVLTTIQRKTALMLAIERDNLDLVMILLRRGAMLTIPVIDSFGCNALHYAARHASTLLTEIVLLCGCSNTVRNEKGYLPSEEAKLLNRMETVVTITTHKRDAVDHLMRLDFLLAQRAKEIERNYLRQQADEVLTTEHSPVDFKNQNIRSGSLERVVGGSGVHGDHQRPHPVVSKRHQQFQNHVHETSFDLPQLSEIEVRQTDNNDDGHSSPFSVSSQLDSQSPNLVTNFERGLSEIFSGVNSSERVNKIWGREKAKEEQNNQKQKSTEHAQNNVLSSMSKLRSAVQRDTIMIAPTIRKTVLQLGFTKHQGNE
jgi:hypothetical protein